VWKKEQGWQDGSVNWGFWKKADLPTAHQYTDTNMGHVIYTLFALMLSFLFLFLFLLFTKPKKIGV